MSFINEFKKFALKGNMVDLAIGVIIGNAFSQAVHSLVDDIIMPPITLLLKGINFEDWKIDLHLPGLNTNAQMGIGNFLNALMSMLIVTLTIFVVIKVMNRFRRQAKKEKQMRSCPYCAMEIPHHAKKCGHCCSPLHTEVNSQV